VEFRLNEKSKLELTNEILYDSTVTINTSRHKSRGFFVSKDIILTCAHVLKDTKKELIIVTQDNQQYKILDYEVNLDIDIAVIKIKPNLDRKTSYVYLDTDCQLKDNFYTYGYSSKDQNGELVKVHNRSYLNLDRRIFFIGKDIKTLSGSPLLNQRTQRVCGIVRSNHTLISDNGMKFTGRDAIPVDVIFEKFPAIKKLNYDLHQTSPTICNLPEKDHKEFIGRNGIIEQLLKYISPAYRQHIIIVNGISGSGKTALVLEAAYRCWDARINYINNAEIPIFNTIIFISLETRSKFTNYSVSANESNAEFRLSFILDTILDTINEKQIGTIEEESKKVDLVYKSLSEQPTLLIIDGLNDIHSGRYSSILDFLNNLPPSTKAIITNRDRLLSHAHVSIDSLSKEEGLQLIKYQSKVQGISLNHVQIQEIYERSDSLPSAIIYEISQCVKKGNTEKSNQPDPQKNSRAAQLTKSSDRQSSFITQREPSDLMEVVR
jgi:hypothetical protein